MVITYKRVLLNWCSGNFWIYDSEWYGQGQNFYVEKRKHYLYFMQEIESSSFRKEREQTKANLNT